MNCLYTIPLCNFGFAFRHATCVIVKDFGKALLKTKSSPIFFSYKLSERKPLFEIAHDGRSSSAKHKRNLVMIWNHVCLSPPVGLVSLNRVGFDIYAPIQKSITNR